MRYRVEAVGPFKPGFGLSWGSSTLSLLHPILTLHHDSTQYLVDSRLVTGPLDLNRFWTSISMRNEILRFRGRFQRASAPMSSSTGSNKSSSTDARSSITFPGRALASRRFAFLGFAFLF